MRQRGQGGPRARQPAATDRGPRHGERDGRPRQAGRHGLLACLADGDAAAAERLPAIDQAVDRLNDRVFAQITRSKSKDPTALGWAPQLVLLARFLERLGDQAVDVGEQVRFIVTGEVRELLPPKAARIPADAGRS